MTSHLLMKSIFEWHLTTTSSSRWEFHKSFINSEEPLRKLPTIALQMHSFAIASIFASAQFVLSEELVTERQGSVTICGCPGSLTGKDVCKDFMFDECTPHYIDFDESKEIMAYLKPVYEYGVDGTVITYSYSDEDCTIRGDFQLISSCTNECWSETLNLGSGGCTFEAPFEDKGSVTMSGCPGRTTGYGTRDFKVEQCTPHYIDFDPSKGVMAYFKPVWGDRDGQGITSVTTYAYSDKDCTNLDFQVEGKCNEECWSESLNLGAVGCESSAPFKSGLAVSFPVFVLVMILF
ncbi:predicted protein [Chaetoceros tenuissimus]|uniref:Uncharacterized protein n=1 Tax=Chaetoceros tenuissimus TaxID=426638 RepID=A0AAD3D265_9STRA|nr:predicted protein [Chaetoceros tenuissimus]